MKNALIITYNDFFKGSAGSLRQESFALIFKDYGFEPYIVSMEKDDYEFNKCYKYNDINIYSLRKNKKSLLYKFINYFGHSIHLKQFLKKMNFKFDLVMIVDAPLTTWCFIKKYCKKNNIILLHDCVEWYSKEEFKSGLFSIQYLKKDYINKFLIDKNIKVISISSYLEDYFKKKNIKTIRIPVILNKERFTENKINQNSMKKFIYAGNPGGKDSLGLMLEGFSLLNKKKLKNVLILIYGATQEDLSNYIDSEVLEKLKNNIKCFGKVSREKVIEAYKDADFSMLMRDQKLRYAKAGFPTKIPESMILKVPPITNLTSDLGKYLKHLDNSVIVKDFSSGSFKNSLEIALNVDPQNLKKIKENARLTALNNFEYRIYKKVLYEFIFGDEK